MLKTMTVDIEGLHCRNCTAEVQRGLKTLDGVRHVEVSLQPGLVTLQIDPSRLTATRIETACKELGYHARVRRTGPIRLPA